MCNATASAGVSAIVTMTQTTARLLPRARHTFRPAPKCTIVLAWLTYRFDGVRHVPTAHACVWLKAGTEADRRNLIRSLREGEIDHQLTPGAMGTDVLVYAADEADPLGQARARMMRVHEMINRAPVY